MGDRDILAREKVKSDSEGLEFRLVQNNLKKTLSRFLFFCPFPFLFLFTLFISFIINFIKVKT